MRHDAHESDGESKFRSLYRRRVLQIAASGTAVAGFGVDPASADEGFVEIIGTDPSGYPDVDVSVSVDSDAGRDGELTEDDFEVYENGEPVEIVDFEYSASSLDLAFVFDDSGSMGNEISAMKRGVKDLTEELEAAGIDARYGLVSFRDDVDTDLTFTDDPDSLKDAVDSLEAYGGGDFPEDNFDAIATALEDDYREDAQKVIVDITDAESHYDGDGSGFSEYTLGDVADDLNERGASFIAVSPGYDDPEASLKVLAEETDGLWIDIADADFGEILDRITRQVIELYVLRYETAAEPGGVGEVSVEVEDPDLGTDDSSSEVRVPEDAGPTVPAEFEALREEKLDLAGRIESISGGLVEDGSDVSRLLSDLESRVRDGDVEGSNAIESIRRLLLAETVTERTLVYAGPAEPESGGEPDYDIATTTAETTVDTVFTCLLSLLPLGKIAKRVPGADRVISTVRKHATNTIKRILDATLGNLGGLARRVKNDTDEIAKDLYELAVDEGVSRGSTISRKQTSKSSGLYDRISSTLVEDISAGSSQASEPNLRDALETATDAADPTTDLTFDGSLSGAENAESNGLSAIEETAETATDEFETYDAAIDVAGIGGEIVTIAQIGGIFATGGLLTAIATVADILLSLANAALGFMKANTGYGTLLEFRDENAAAIDGIVRGEVR